jgi:hypothetical protein
VEVGVLIGTARSVVVGGLVYALLAACGGSSAPADRVTPTPTPTTSGPAPADADPARLVASWHVEAPDEDPGSILTIGNHVDGTLLLWRDCGFLEGDWRANRHGMFVAGLYGGNGDCFDRGGVPPFPDWLDRVVGFRAEGDAELLVDETGQTVARLTPGARPSPVAGALPEYASPPVVTPDMRRSFQEPAPLPDGVEPAGQAALLGRWVPAGKPQSKAFVTYDEDGSYDGSDGCNRQSGRYLVGADGIVLGTSGPSTLIGCENSPLPVWITQAGRVGLRTGRLVFVAPAGKVLGEAERG